MRPRAGGPAVLIPFTFLPPAAAVLLGAIFTNLVVMIVALGLTGFSFQLLKVLADAMVGGASADAVRGRVFSIYDVLYNVAFVLAGLLMIPLWKPARDHVLLGALAVAFLVGGGLFASGVPRRHVDESPTKRSALLTRDSALING